MSSGTFRCWLGVLLVLLFNAPVMALEQLPGWAVPVLRLVSATHVEPTTGIVVSSDGLVIVPGDFASEDDEIVVLDGGTDIVRNGRPARIDRRLEYVGLKVIRVDGLARRPAVFASTPPVDGTTVWLAAFPPAERIAVGDEPLWEERRMVRTPGAPQTALSFNAPLPDVTGALVDACGYLLGVSVQDGVQEMTPSPQTRYRWSAEVQDALNAKRVDTRTAACDGPPGDEESVVEERAATDASEEDAASEHPAEDPIDAAPGAEDEPDTGQALREELAKSEPDEGGLEELKQLPPLEDAQPGHWAWLLAAALLLLTGAGIHFWRRRRAQDPLAGTEAPDGSEWQAPAMTHRLLLSGRDAQGNRFECACPVSDRAINCVVGSGAVDLVIEAAGVLAGHARLFGTADALMITGLEAGAEIRVNGVPCLQDETLYIEQGQSVQFGSVLCQLTLKPAEES